MRLNKPSRKIRIKKKKRKKPAISISFIVYTLIGAVILLVLYMAVIKKHDEKIQDIKQDKISTDMDRICLAALLYFQDYGEYPLLEQGTRILTRAYLKNAEKKSPSAKIGFLDHVPVDPWGNRYSYEYSTKEDAVILQCQGADGKPGGTGEAADIIRKGCPPTILPGLD